MPVVHWGNQAREERIWSAVLVHLNGRGVLVPCPDPLAHVPLQCLDAAVVAALEHPAGDLLEQAPDLVQPARIGRREVHVEARVAFQPCVHARRLVGPVVVAHHVHVEPVGHLGVDLPEERDELGGPVPAVRGADHGPVGNVHRGERARGAVPHVVMGAPLGHSWHHRQGRPGAPERLNPALLVHAQHDRAFGRVQVQSDHVMHPVREQRVVRRLEPVLRMGLEVERAPDAARARPADPDALGHQPPAPVRRVPRRLLQRRRQQVLDHPVGDRRRSARPRLVRQAVQPRLEEPAPPLAHRRQAHADPFGDLLVRQSLRARQHDPATQRQSLRRPAAPGPTLQLVAFPVAQCQPDPGPPRPRHTPAIPESVNELKTQDTRLSFLPSSSTSPAESQRERDQRQTPR